MAEMAVKMATAAVGSIIQGNAAKAAADANAKIADQNRRAAFDQSSAREDAFRRKARYALGEQAAAIAESGVDPGSGSALRVATESATNAELDAMNIRYEGLMQGFGFERQASIERQRGKHAQRMGYLGAASPLFGEAADSYLKGMKTTAEPYDFWKSGYGGRY